MSYSADKKNASSDKWSAQRAYYAARGIDINENGVSIYESKASPKRIAPASAAAPSTYHSVVPVSAPVDMGSSVVIPSNVFENGKGTIVHERIDRTIVTNNGYRSSAPGAPRPSHSEYSRDADAEIRRLKESHHREMEALKAKTRRYVDGLKRKHQSKMDEQALNLKDVQNALLCAQNDAQNDEKKFRDEIHHLRNTELELKRELKRSNARVQDLKREIEVCRFQKGELKNLMDTMHEHLQRDLEAQSDVVRQLKIANEGMRQEIAELTERLRETSRPTSSPSSSESKSKSSLSPSVPEFKPSSSSAFESKSSSSASESKSSSSSSSSSAAFESKSSLSDTTSGSFLVASPPPFASDSKSSLSNTADGGFLDPSALDTKTGKFSELSSPSAPKSFSSALSLSNTADGSFLNPSQFAASHPPTSSSSSASAPESKSLSSSESKSSLSDTADGSDDNYFLD